MGLFDRKVKEIELREEESVNLAKATSDKAVDVIKELSGKRLAKERLVIDNLIVFSNASGGTGTSTLLSNVAYEATRRGQKVLIIDLNIMYPTQHTYLNIQQQLEKPDLVGYLLGKDSLSDAIDTTNEINIMFANNRTLADDINCNDKVPIENFKELCSKVRQFYDLVLIDCPNRIDNMLSNTAFYLADAIYLVWDEGIGSIINTDKMRRNMAFSGIDSFTKMRVIMNKRTSIRYSDYPFKKMNLELVEVLPFDPDIIDNSLRGQIFCDKGASKAKNAIEFAVKCGELTESILKIAGLISEQ